MADTDNNSNSNNNNGIYKDTYRVLQQLGKGGTATVYLAEHIRLGRKVVLKREKIVNPKNINKREIEVLKLLKHKYIPSVYDYFEEGNYTVTVMDYVPGESLDIPFKNAKKEGRTFKYSQAQVIKWAKQLLEALDYLHSPIHGDPPRSFVHSDIKPANIMLLPNGDISLIDFNISFALGDHSFSGYTTAYASPEHMNFNFTGSGSFTQTSVPGRSRGGTSTRTWSSFFSNSTNSSQQSSQMTGQSFNASGSQSSSPETSAERSDLSDGRSRTVGESNKDKYSSSSSTGRTSGETSDYPGQVPDRPPVSNENDETVDANSLTVTMPQPVPPAPSPSKTQTGRTSSTSSSSGFAALRTSPTGRILPDARSDIYCLGLTLYFLLTGVSPKPKPKDKKPRQVEDFVAMPIPEGVISQPFADILAKAVEPDPCERYQTAAEMLHDLDMLHYNDPRAKKLRRGKRVVAAVFAVMFAAGLFTSFVGLRRGNIEKASVNHADEALALISSGDTAGAVGEALAGLPAKNMLFSPDYLAKPQAALTSAVKVYDLRDGFKNTVKVKLSGVPSFVRLSEDGTKGAAVCTGKLEIFSTADGSIIKQLDCDSSYLAEVEFIDNDTIAFAGVDGLTVYEIGADKIRWTGQPATAVAVSADGSTVAGIYKDETTAAAYDTQSGTLKTVALSVGHQPVPDEITKLNDTNIFELNKDGSSLLASVLFDETFEALGGQTNAVLYDLAGIDGVQWCSNYTNIVKMDGAFADDMLITIGSEQNGKSTALGSYRKSVDTPWEEHNIKGDIFSVKSYDGMFYITSSGKLSVKTPDELLNGLPGTEIPFEDIVTAFDTDGNYLLTADGNNVLIHSVNGTKISYPEGAGKTALPNVCAIRNGTAVYGDLSSDELQVAAYIRSEENFAADYPADFFHSETRLSADGKHYMQFSSLSFRILDENGNVTTDVTPLPDNAADPQYRRDEKGSYLEVTCTDGRKVCYDSTDGSIISDTQGESADLEKTEFITDSYKIVSYFQKSTAEIYDRLTGKKIGEFEKQNGELIYVYQAGSDLITHYILAKDLSDSGDMTTCAYLLNKNFEVIGEMDYLTDYNEKTGMLLFDYPEGSLRTTKLYSIDELIQLAKTISKA